MKLQARHIALSLPLLMTACFHRAHNAQVQPTAPPIQPKSQATAPPAPTVVQPPTPSIPTQPPVAASSATITPEQPKPVHHRKPTDKTTEQAANETPAINAIGQLSTGDPTQMQRDTANSIAATERSLNGITRTLNGQEQKTAAQIREFLKQARAALASGDVDGAHTLARKAEVLLGELNH